VNSEETQKLIIDESSIARQLKKGFERLRFDEAGVEIQFRREFVRDRLKRIRENLFLALSVLVAFALADSLIVGEFSRTGLYLLQFGGLVPILGILIALTYHRRPHVMYPRWSPWLATLLGFGMILVDVRASLDGVDALFSGVLVYAVFSSFLLGLLFYESLAVGAALWAIYLAVALGSGLPESAVLYNAIVLLMVFVISATVNYSIEEGIRHHFLERHQLREMSATVVRDGLTGLYNRKAFDEHLNRHWSMAQREGVTLAMILIDIDYFKRYNEEHGHKGGDACLRKVAQALARTARRPFDFAARYGGEEFAIILYDTTKEYLDELSLSIHQGVSALSIRHGASDVSDRVTVSVGIAFVVPQMERSADGIVQAADQALYQAKLKGRNQTSFDNEASYAAMKTGYFQKPSKAA
jgi:diguanylate cyclase (GGDEF)-like protein